jgi:hypothetical protein
MNENEITLLNMIYENDRPDQAIQVAIKVFAAFLEQLEVAPEPPAGGLPESA